MRKTLRAALVAAVTCSSGVASAQEYAPIPPPQVEVGPPPVAPGPAYVLEPGHWHWNGYRYIWIGRHWVVRQAGWVHWVPGHWYRGRFGRWHWAPGHWGG